MACSTTSPPRPWWRASARRGVVYALSLALSGLALAAPPPAEVQARAVAQQGKAAYEAGDFETAIARYGEAYQLQPAPPLLFNLAQSHRKAGHLAEAIAAFQRYLESGPPEAQAAATRAVLREVEAAQQEAQLRARAQAAQAEAQAAARRADEAEAAAAESSRAARARAEAAQAEAAQAKARLDEELARRAAPQPPPPVTQRWWFWTAIGVAVAGGVTAGVLAATAPKPTPTTFPDINAR